MTRRFFVLAFAPALCCLALTGISATPSIQLLSTTPDWTAVEVDQAGALLGNNVSTAGDVNGDGFDDVLVGARLLDNPEVDEGKTFLYLGSAAGLSLTPAWTFESDQPGAQVGRAMAAGDVNGDGFGDVIVGSGLYDNDQVDEGRAWLFLGSSSGLSTTPAWIVESNQSSSAFGVPAVGVGDINGDGFDDVMVSATFIDFDLVDEGGAFLYLGSPTGPSTTADQVIEGNQTLSLFGRTAGAGDVNGDGFDDVLLGAASWDGGQQDEGRVFVMKGSAQGLRKHPLRILEINEVSALFGNVLGTAGDINADGFDDILVTTQGTGVVNRVFVYMGSRMGPGAQPDLVLQTDQQNTTFGQALGTAGDVNNDGFSDVIVGARLYDVVTLNEGRVFVYAGTATGLDPTPLQTFDGSQTSEEFGVAVSTAGDVNGDGFSDIIIGAHAFDNPESNEGRVVAFHGGP